MQQISSSTIADSDGFDGVAALMQGNLAHVLAILLLSRSQGDKRHIIWANDNYTHKGRAYLPNAPMTCDLITGENCATILPRALKSHQLQKQRTKARAEVFTPMAMVQKQNEALEEAYLADDLATYVGRTWLEITCGEAPYMATRYDMQTGKPIALGDRVGFVDKKLQRINAETKSKKHWQSLAYQAYRASYGFEWSGDSLLLARINLFYTFLDYHRAKWGDDPSPTAIKNIANIISYNLFQMDGLTGHLPLADYAPVQIKNWHSDKMQYFRPPAPAPNSAPVAHQLALDF